MRTAFLTALTTPVLLLAACNGDPIVNQNAAPVASVGDDIEQPANLNVFHHPLIRQADPKIPGR